MFRDAETGTRDQSHGSVHIPFKERNRPEIVGNRRKSVDTLNSTFLLVYGASLAQERGIARSIGSSVLLTRNENLQSATGSDFGDAPYLFSPGVESKTVKTNNTITPAIGTSAINNHQALLPVS